MPGTFLPVIRPPSRGRGVPEHVAGQEPGQGNSRMWILRNSMGDLRGFASDLENAQAILPRAQIAQVLAEVSRRLGDESGAQRWEEQARRLAP